MKKYIFIFLFLIIFSFQVYAFSFAVSPSEIIFDENEKVIQISIYNNNPYDIEVYFSIIGDYRIYPSSIIINSDNYGFFNISRGKGFGNIVIYSIFKDNNTYAVSIPISTIESEEDKYIFLAKKRVLIDNLETHKQNSIIYNVSNINHKIGFSVSLMIIIIGIITYYIYNFFRKKSNILFSFIYKIINKEN
jgi:hypothetical protein